MNSITTATRDIPAELQRAIDLYLKNVQTKSGTSPSDADRENFLNICIANKLNPFKRQAHLVGYDGKNGATFTAIVGIDGFRAIATRSGKFLGGKVIEMIMQEGGKLPDYCTYIVKRAVGAHVAEFEATAYYAEAVQTTYTGQPNSVWSKQPRLMLQKVAEALALRKAFPDDMGGLYTDDEIAVTSAATPMSEDQAQKILELIDTVSMSENRPVEELKKHLRDTFGDPNSLSHIDAKNVILFLQETYDAIKAEYKESKKTVVAIEQNRELPPLTDADITIE
jgi:phage recombination protein Bet